MSRCGEHPEQGSTALVFALRFAAACLASHAYHAFGDRVRERIGWQDPFRLPMNENMALYLVSMPLAALALWTMLVAGHSGATLVWKTNR